MFKPLRLHIYFPTNFRSIYIYTLFIRRPNVHFSGYVYVNSTRTLICSERPALSISALASASQRRNLLQGLFADIAFEVDDRAKERIFGEEDVISAADVRYGCPICFYNVLADYFVYAPQNGQSILHLIVQFWSQSFASNIFTLLFHKWMFEVEFDNPEVLLRFSLALVQGVTNVFWIDIQTNARRFFSLFQYLLEEVALDSERSKKIPLQAQRDLFLLLSRFLLFYDIADKLENFLKRFPNAFLIGSAPDIFVTELADQLQNLKVEPVLLHYLSQIKVIQGLELRMATITRLKTCLYSFTTPGGPMYPTRAVRHAAWAAFDFLFPVGRYPRYIISFFFRLQYPLLAILLLGLPTLLHTSYIPFAVGIYFSSWEKKTESKQS